MCNITSEDKELEHGSGKSTLAEIILKEKQLEFLNADEIAREISPDAIDKVPITAGKEYIKRLNNYFNDNKSFAVESTLSGKNFNIGKNLIEVV